MVLGRESLPDIDRRFNHCVTPPTKSLTVDCRDVTYVQMAMVVGILSTLCGCAWLWTITFFSTPHLQVIGPAVLIGFGGSVLIVTALAMGTDVIGSHSVSLLSSTFC